MSVRVASGTLIISLLYIKKSTILLGRQRFILFLQADVKIEDNY